jgi:hypothetical protein
LRHPTISPNLSIVSAGARKDSPNFAFFQHLDGAIPDYPQFCGASDAAEWKMSNALWRFGGVLAVRRWLGFGSGEFGRASQRLPIDEYAGQA